MMKKSIIIVAGGTGSRMGSDIPKQFLCLSGRPVLMHTIEKFYNYDTQIIIVVVLPVEQISYWKELCKEHDFNIHHEVIEGGSTRFHSVRNGLSRISNDGFVGVHDGVRPLVSIDTIKRTYDLAHSKQCVIPVVDVFESVRFVEDNLNYAVNRDSYKLVQTPQVFNIELLKNAYKQDYIDSFTDDASVCEKAGHKVFLTAGNRENIKVTTPVDLIIAEAFLKHSFS